MSLGINLTSLLLQRHFHEIVPEAEVEAEVAMFTAEAEDKLLQGNPDFVLDAIDDIETKVNTHHRPLMTGFATSQVTACACHLCLQQVHLHHILTARDPFVSIVTFCTVF